MEECDDGTLELGTTASVHSGWREGLPDDRLADVRRDEERNAGAEAVPFLNLEVALKAVIPCKPGEVRREGAR